MTAHSLSERHIRFITLGGAVGSGLFLASGTALRDAGPALLLAYLVGGITVFLVCRAMGELVLARPGLGAFADFAAEFIGPWAGFVTAWSYWLIWMIVGIAETTAAGIFVQYWFPGVPQWLTAAVSVAILGSVNLASLRAFGEVEFWLAALKVVTIIGLIAAGIVLLLIGHGDPNNTGVQNLWRFGGFLPHGINGLFMAIPMAVFAFGGVEMIGLTVSGHPDQERVVPNAVNGVLGRILIFYVGSFAIILMLFPWLSLDPSQSPFVLVFSRIGFPAAGSFINAVVLAAVLSSCNSGIFAASRMLRASATEGNAPRIFARTNRFGTPVHSVLLSTAILLAGVVINYVAPDNAFEIVTSILAVLILWIWGGILVSHLLYRLDLKRRSMAPGSFALPGGIFTDVICLAVLLSVIVLMSVTGRMYFAFLTGTAWFVFIIAAYAIRQRFGPGSGTTGALAAEPGIEPPAKPVLDQPG